MRALTLIGLCAAVGLLACESGSELSWERLEAVGGLAVGPATRLVDGRLRIPVRCNLAGIDSITSKPTQLNSGVGVERLKFELEGNVLFITVLSGLGGPAQCPAIEITHGGSALRAVYRSQGRSRSLGPIQVAP